MAFFIKGYLQLMEWLNRVVKWLCIILTSAMCLVVLFQIFMRYIPGINPPPWTEELARYLMIYSAFLGASTGIKKWNMIAVDYFSNRMSPRNRKLLETIIQILILAFLVFVTYLSVSSFSRVGFRQKSATLGFHMFYPQSAVIVGCFIMSLQLAGILLAKAGNAAERKDAKNA